MTSYILFKGVILWRVVLIEYFVALNPNFLENSIYSRNGKFIAIYFF